MCLPTTLARSRPNVAHIAGLTSRKIMSWLSRAMPFSACSNTALNFASLLAQRVFGAAGAQERVDRGDEHRRLDRMRDVAVGAGVEALHLVDVVDEGRGEVDDRRARRRRRGAQAAADLEAVDVGQVDVEHDQVEGLGGQRAALPVRCRPRCTVKPAARRTRPVEYRVGRVVVDDEDRGGCTRRHRRHPFAAGTPVVAAPSSARAAAPGS